MNKITMRITFGLAAVIATATPSAAQQAAERLGCQVHGLNPRGDGFLAIRTGPGANHRQIGSLYNGDFAYLDRGCGGNWCHADSFERSNGQRLNFSGWIHKRWCRLYP